MSKTKELKYKLELTEYELILISTAFSMFLLKTPSFLYGGDTYNLMKKLNKLLTKLNGED